MLALRAFGEVSTPFYVCRESLLCTRLRLSGDGLKSRVSAVQGHLGFLSLKSEWVVTDYATEEEARMEVFKYIEMFYGPT